MPPTALNGKKCLVTGAASGIGRALAQTLAQQGAHLFLTDINERPLQELVESLRHAGGQVGEARALDIADYASVAKFAAAIQARHGSLDVVMNVAGVATWGAIEHLKHEDWRRTIDINLMGPIHVMECFIPPMIRAARGGHLVNVSSAAGLFGLPLHAPYSASKYGLRGASDVLRHDLKHHNIRVSLVCPGGVDTGLVQTVKIQGVDMSSPQVERLKTRFRQHAVSPQAAAEAILRGMQAGRYLIFTSADIRMAYWLQCKCTPLVDWALSALNRYAVKVLLPKDENTGA